MLVSAIVPTLDRPGLLRRALKSVEAQTHEPIEVLVVASPQTPDVRHAVNDLDVHRSKFIDANADSPARAWNVGIEEATGEFVGFLCDDETWDATKIERQLHSLSGTAAGASLTGVRKLGPDGQFYAASRPTAEGNITRDLLEYRFVSGTISAMLVRRDIAKAVDGFDERFVLLEDGDFYVRVSRETEYRVESEPLVTRHDGNHDQITEDVDRRLRDEESFIRKHRDLAQRYGASTEERMIAYLKFDSGRMAANQGKYGIARRRISSAIRHHPKRLAFLIWLGLVSGGSLTYRPAQFTKRSVANVIDSVTRRAGNV